MLTHGSRQPEPWLIFDVRQKVSRPKIVVVDVSGATSKVQLHDLLAAGFAFPSYYGKNWDAFYDCITTLDPMPERIVVRGLKALFKRLPLDSELLTDILKGLQSSPKFPGIAVEFE